MIKLSRMADYAVLLLTRMAQQETALYSAQSLSLQTQLSLPTVSKILKTLAKADILVSVRGSRGGYALVRPAGQINIAQVIEAIDGPITLTECTGSHKGECTLESSCPTRTGWFKINRTVKEALSNVSLAELTVPAPVFLAPHLAHC